MCFGRALFSSTVLLSMLGTDSLSGCVGAIVRYTASGHAMVGQDGPSTLASADGNDSTISLVVLGVANVHVDAVVFCKDTYTHSLHATLAHVSGNAFRASADVPISKTN